VLVIEDGQIVERGKHEDLLAKKGAYYTLYMSQFITQNGNNGSGAKPASDSSGPSETLASAGSGI